MEIENKIGERLFYLRKSKKLNQTQLANKLNTSQTFISKCEKGMVKIPPEIFLGYANYFEVSLDYIFGRTDKIQGEVGIPRVESTEAREQAKEVIANIFNPKTKIHNQFKERLIKLVLEELK